ncbi:MAG: hypothetical protein JNL41_10580 [Phenylobacterium sp.]|uniref:hypothetical protein n=1 Tax=Phenylobacterium sp. TaxID=1871053 RepID=UPI001A3C013D|nr:hypothetical protein [Phenylobacterium sp.]MBL8554713.1 hypothetical protein [Phenylobacterium sp.]
MRAATRDVFENMAQVGGGDAGALAVGLRHGVTSVGLRALAAKTLHVAVAAPERMADIYDNAAAGWLSGPIFPPRLRTDDALPISPDFWRVFWDLVSLPASTAEGVTAERILELAGQLDPGINARMAATALEYPGVAEAAADGLPGPLDVGELARRRPASLAFLLNQELERTGGVAEPFGPPLVALLRHMPPPLNYINIRVIQTLPLLGLVAGYGRAGLDRAALGGFLMAQVAHHYSALSTAVTLGAMSLRRPSSLELTLDSIFKGWTHGRATPPLIGAAWDELWDLRLDEVRATLGVTAFDSPYAAARRLADAGKTRH